MKRVLKRIGISLLVLMVVIVGCFVFVFRNEIKTLCSIEKVDDYTLYTMEYSGDYGFDDFLETGASNDDELVDFVVSKLLKGIPVEFSIPDLGCSTFNAKTSDGDYIFGRNFDLTYSPALFVKTAPNNGYKSMSTVNLGFLGFNEDKQPDSLKNQIITLAAPYAPLDGVNEKGVSIGVLLIPDEATDQQTDKIDITTTTAVRLVLDKAASVDEAIELLKKYDMHSSAKSAYHFQIADSDGKSVVVEYIDDKLSVVKADKAYQMATNFLLTKSYYNQGFGQDRYKIMKDILDKDQGEVINESEGMNILQKVSQDIHKNENGEDSATQWSVVYNNTDLTANIIVGRKYQEKVHKFSLK